MYRPRMSQFNSIFLSNFSQVYTSHMQLGGPRVMGVNGVSHHVVPDDLEGVKAILRWGAAGGQP